MNYEKVYTIIDHGVRAFRLREFSGRETGR